MARGGQNWSGVKRVGTPPLLVPKKGRTSTPPSTKTNSVASASACSDDSWSSSKSQPVRSPSLGLSINNIPTSNQSSSETTASVDPVSETIQRPPKIPPIFLPDSAWRKVAPKLMSAVPVDGIIAKACDNNTIKLQCVDIDLFRIVQKYLHKNCIDFHTVPSPIERTIKIVIRGLLPDIMFPMTSSPSSVHFSLTEASTLKSKVKTPPLAKY